MNSQLQNNRPVSPVASFNAFMQKHKSQLELALPKHLNADRMVRLSLTAFSQTPALQECDPKTIFASIIIASQLGLEIGVNGQGYLVPYKKKCTFIPGWKGLVDLANRGGRCTVWTGAVYEGDEFDYMLGDAPYCRHKPCGEFDEAKLTHVYAIGRVKDSEMAVIEVWPVQKVRAHFKKVVVPALQPNHYSKKYFEAYAKKVALLQLLKYMPQSVEMANAMDVSHAAESGKGVTIDGDFVTVDNSQTEEEETAVQVNTLEENNSQNLQAEQEDHYAPTFAQIKRGVLTAKTIPHLEVMEEQAMDHADKEERKQLMSLVKAQRQKMEGTSVKKTDDVQHEPDPVAEQEVQKVNTSRSPELKKQYSVKLTNAKTFKELSQISFEIKQDLGLTDAHRSYLNSYEQQRQADLTKKEAKKVDEDMFADVVDAELSYVDAVVLRIQNAATMDDINAEYADPAIEELSDADRKRIDDAASKREDELFKM
ncbi:recombinase RecT [Acinetobacter sp. 243_ASPC]|uniref:recombinase RecT n=1 Tax=Acinetobacter sp. 243_ASPC TaxID=1579345 RepID=UPI00069D76C2|nr:recombinase RecT [Acinetobacter sp. 243_ASPC]